jgi:hypothetical protein
MERNRLTPEQRRQRARSLHWHHCGPDLAVFADTNEHKMITLLKRYGEIRFRYAAHLTATMALSKDPWDWLRLIEYACKERWLSTYTMHRTAEILQSRIWTAQLGRMPIPWVNDSVNDLTKNQRAFIEESCASTEQVGPTLPFCRLYDWSVFMDMRAPVRVRLHPDLRFDNVIAWLCFVVEGFRDPQLQGAHEKFQPHVKQKDARRYRTAWEKVVGAAVR